MKLNVEEMNLLYIFDTSTRTAALQDILSRRLSFENEELKEICEQLVRKLEQMTDEEFSKLDFTMYEEDDENEL